jgi:hypothetical protein
MRIMKVALASGLLLAATAAVFTEGTRRLLAEPPEMPAAVTAAESSATPVAPPADAASADVRVVYPVPWALTKLPRQPPAETRPVGEPPTTAPPDSARPDTSALRAALSHATGARIVRTIPIGPPAAGPAPATMPPAAVAAPEPPPAAAEPMAPEDVQVLAKEFDGPPTPPVRPARVPESRLIDLNTAPLAALDGLGAGKIGRAIIRGRPYAEAEDLVTKRVLKRSTFDRIKSRVEAR